MGKHKKILPIVAIAFLLCAATIGILWGIKVGKLDIFKKGEDGDTSDTKIEATAKDEATLRELLADESEITIHITEDMEVEEGFIVNGVKTLTGNAELRMSLGAELGQALLNLSENSSLTLNGPVLNGNYNGDGIHVGTGATFTSLSSTIKYAGAYGILNYGTVTIEDIDIADCEYISVCAQTGSKVYMKGGSIQRSASNDIYLVSGSYVNISGNTVMEGAREHAMINYGTLEIHDGKFGNVNNYLCDNYGELTVAYKGNAENGYIEFYGARNSVFLVRKDSVANISDLYVHDTKRQGVSSLGGKTSISNCRFENTGSHSIDMQGAEATIENVTSTGSQGSGLEASGGAVVRVNNFNVTDCQKIGVASRGATITATNINVKNTGTYGITCGNTKAGHGILKVADATIQGPAKHGVYIYDKGEAELKNIKLSDGALRGMYVAATATCKLSGDSSIQKMTKGGVEVRGNLQLDSVVICDNNVTNSGAGVYVADGGKVTMNGGAVYNNNSELRGGGICVSDATITINGSKIYNNKSVNNGGGLYVQKTSVVNLNNGEIAKNKSEANGNGIYIASAESKVTMGENFYLGGNDVKIQNVKTALYISGNGLKKHSSSDPLLLTPNYDAEEGTAVAVCKNETVAKRIANMVKSGDGSYNVIRDNKNFAIQYATADMDMTGADKVYVSNFQQLKEAVLSTTSKRYIVLTSDIKMEERIRVPGGVTICIKDDGVKRTLTRNSGFTDNFFVTHYGTGLYLTGTADKMLVLDGGYVASADHTKNQSLIRVAGSTELRNVVLQNNGTLVKDNQVRGALMRQLYGDFKIYHSVLSGGNAYSAGALMIDKGKGYVEGSTLKDNVSTIGGGAIRAAGGCKLEVVSSTISGNHAGSTGGGLVALEGSEVTVMNTKLENNTAASYGGALSAQDKGTHLSVIGTESASAVFKNNSSKTAGAIYMVSQSQLEVSGYSFESNAATDGRAGAISALSNASATITNTAFYGNKATASGGAIVADTSNVHIISCDFGKENAGNEAGDKAGAVLVAGNGTVDMTTTEDGKYNSLSYNTAKGVGGVIYVDKGSVLKAKNYTFEGNKGSSGGAIYVVAGGNAVCENNQFENNTAISGETYGNGGAVYCAGTFEDTNSSYSKNVARNGGALIVMSGGEATLEGTSAKAVMQGNKANVNGGGAVFVNGGGLATVTGYTLEGNMGKNPGSVQVQATGTATLKNLTFKGETGKRVYVLGSLNFNNLSGVILVDAGTKTNFVVSGYQDGNVVEFTPNKYESKVVLQKAKEMADEEFKAACNAITVSPSPDGTSWRIDEKGTLVQHLAASITADGKTEYFGTLKDAVDYANANGGTGEAVAIEIVVLENTAIDGSLNITKSMTILNAPGKKVTISRSTQEAYDMFAVGAGAMLTLGTNDAKEAGKLIVDGATTKAIAGRTVSVPSGAGFVLAKNATLQNANSTATGAALQTASANTAVYGTIQGNVTTVDAGGLDAQSGAKVTIDGAAFSGNQAKKAPGALCIRSGAVVTCENATFSGNKTTGNTNAGAVYCAGTFKDTNSKYSGNEARNGGAIFVAGGSATLKGTDKNKALFEDNQSKGSGSTGGGAIFVNGGSISVTGYTFEGNTSENANKSAVHVAAKRSATLKNVVFQGDTTQNIYVLGTLNYSNVSLTNASITGSGTKNEMN